MGKIPDSGCTHIQTKRVSRTATAAPGTFGRLSESTVLYAAAGALTGIDPARELDCPASSAPAVERQMGSGFAELVGSVRARRDHPARIPATRAALPRGIC